MWNTCLCLARRLPRCRALQASWYESFNSGTDLADRSDADVGYYFVAGPDALREMPAPGSGSRHCIFFVRPQAVQYPELSGADRGCDILLVPKDVLDGSQYAQLQRLQLQLRCAIVRAEPVRAGEVCELCRIHHHRYPAQVQIVAQLFSAGHECLRFQDGRIVVGDVVDQALQSFLF